MHPAAKVLIPVFVGLVGLAMMVTGLLRPALLWETGKARLGRELVGDGPLAAACVVIGVLLLAGAVLSAVRLRRL
ncbi:MAG: hypothetical protein NZ890_05035 [Myxococcota bacterium]|nr:hypothetical protein [Myxococcota bacterium]